MSMGGGGGGGGGGPGASSPEERAYWFQQANPGWSRAQTQDAADSNMSPMQYENWKIGQQMVRGNKALGDPGAMSDIKRYGLQMSGLAQGGLLARGMKQLNQEVLTTPNMAPGIQARMAGRVGVAPGAEQQMAMQQQQALAQASSQVGLSNQVRTGLVNAQRDMRFGGVEA